MLHPNFGGSKRVNVFDFWMGWKVPSNACFWWMIAKAMVGNEWYTIVDDTPSPSTSALDTDSSRTLWKRALKDCWQVLTNLQCHHHHIEDVKLACEFKRQVNLKLLELSEVDTWDLTLSVLECANVWGCLSNGVWCQCKLMWPCFSLLHLPLNGIQYLGLFVIYSTLVDWSSLCCDVSVQCGVCV